MCRNLCRAVPKHVLFPAFFAYRSSPLGGSPLSRKYQHTIGRICPKVLATGASFISRTTVARSGNYWTLDNNTHAYYSFEHSRQICGNRAEQERGGGMNKRTVDRCGIDKLRILGNSHPAHLRASGFTIRCNTAAALSASAAFSSSAPSPRLTVRPEGATFWRE